MFGLVYGLYDPTTRKLRYVGQTTKTLNERLSNHLSPSGLKKHLHVACWLRGLVGAGLKPRAKVLCTAENREELDRFEIEQINSAKTHGADLTNLAVGGGVNSGFKKSSEARAKIALARKGTKLSRDTKNKIAAAMRARILTSEHKQRIGSAHRGKKMSQESRDKMSFAKRNHCVSDAEILLRRASGQSFAGIGKSFGVSGSCVRKRYVRLITQ